MKRMKGLILVCLLLFLLPASLSFARPAAEVAVPLAPPRIVDSVWYMYASDLVRVSDMYTMVDDGEILILVREIGEGSQIDEVRVIIYARGSDSAISYWNGQFHIFHLDRPVWVDNGGMLVLLVLTASALGIELSQTKEAWTFYVNDRKVLFWTAAFRRHRGGMK